jgi:phage terminase large subunit-like protein
VDNCDEEYTVGGVINKNKEGNNAYLETKQKMIDVLKLKEKIVKNVKKSENIEGGYENETELKMKIETLKKMILSQGGRGFVAN